MKLQRNGRTKALAIGTLAVVSSLTLAACGSNNNSGSGASSSASASGSSTASTASADCGSGSVSVLAAGSTAQQNAINAWVQKFQAICPNVTIDYSGTGSSAGRTSFTAGKVAFAGSDAAMKPADEAKTGSACGNEGTAINLPMVGGPISLGYNVPGVSNLVLDASTIAKIFTGKITNWNDAAIKALNPTATLPNLKIQTFHRSDGSGTSANFSAYLAAAAASAFPYASNSQWPAPGGQSAKGSAAVAADVAQTAGAIGYFELSYATAKNITVASVQTTPGGTAVAPSSTTAAAAVSEATVAGTGQDLALKLNYGTTTAGAYPISLVTYEIVCNKGNNAKTLPAVKAFFNYAISPAGQQVAQSVGYMVLPTAISTKVQAEIATLG